MARLIDADALIESGYKVKLDEVFPDWAELPDSTKEAVCKHGQYLKKLINELPTVDSVEVVRCKDCKRYRKSERAQTLEIGWCNKWHNIMEYFDFCSFGEREDNE